MSDITEKPAPTIFNRAWAQITDALLTVRRGAATEFTESNVDSFRRQIVDCLEGKGGEVSSRARAATLGQAYLASDADGRRSFLSLLGNEFDVDQDELAAAIERYQASDDAGRGGLATKLRAALRPGRIELLTQFNALPEGVKFLVDMRADALRYARDDEAIGRVANDLREMLAGWFDIGFLELKRITWAESASILEKLIAYEAVHEIRSWEDLKNRLGVDRRCYGFFHPSMPDEPLIFVEVALVNGMADAIHGLLDETSPEGDPNTADAAIFYSISNAQRGLAGISFGNFLIKRVVDDLSHELPNIKTFATLSPIPGFRAWLAEQVRDEADDLLTEDEVAALSEVSCDAINAAGLLAVVDSGEWPENEALTGALQTPIMRLVAEYLLNAKVRDNRARDPVAHFHLSNGARMERLNWRGDLSGRGLAQSAGVMVNYLYRLDQIDANHEAYTGDRKIVSATAVRSTRKRKR